ncbi:MAG TPA: CorA family divalent cation transporter, partial [Bacillota bacterium]
MVRFLALDQGQVVMGADWQALSDVRQAGAEALWVDLVSPSEEDLETIGAAFGFHPLTLDDCRDRQHRAKVREFEGHFFAILNAVGRRQNGERLVISATEIDFFVGQNYVVSVHRDQVGAIDTFWGQAKRAEVLRQGADFLFYYLCDLIVDEHFPILDRIDGLLDKLEARAFSQPDQAVLKELFHLKRQLIHLRRIL